MIRAYGLLNATVERDSRSYGVPHPGTFIVDRAGRVVSRFFEEAYQERYTAATMLTTLGGTAEGATLTASTAHLSLSAALTDAVAAPGQRLALVVNVVPARNMHVYAPGKHDYQVVR